MWSLVLRDGQGNERWRREGPVERLLGMLPGLYATLRQLTGRG